MATAQHPRANVSSRSPRLEVETFERRNWIFRCQRAPMWGDDDFAALPPEESILKGGSVVDRIPDAFFGNNLLELRYDGSNAFLTADKACDPSNSLRTEFPASTAPSSFLLIRFEARGAAAGMRLEGWEDATSPGSCFLRQLGFTPAVYSVPGADRWKANLESSFGKSQVEIIQPQFDWTCSSKYWGLIQYVRTSPTESINEKFYPESGDDRFTTKVYLRSTNPCDNLPSVPADDRPTPFENGLDNRCERLQQASASVHVSSPPQPLPVMELLNTTLPILWFQHCYLFVDDLSDSGSNCTDVKIRVMPEFWFVAYQQQIRVDRVGLRQVAVRLFHRFGEADVVRHLLWSEATDAVLRLRAAAACNSTNSNEATVAVSAMGDPEPTEKKSDDEQPRSDGQPPSQPHLMTPSFEFLRPEDVLFSVVQRIPVSSI